MQELELEGQEQKQDSSRVVVSSTDFRSVSSSSSTATMEHSSSSSVDAQEQKNSAATNDNAENVQQSRSVHFAEAVNSAFIGRDTQSEIYTKWYTAEDTERFSLILASDARRMAAALADLPHPSMVHEDELRECVGMEVRSVRFFEIISRMS